MGLFEAVIWKLCLLSISILTHLPLHHKIRHRDTWYAKRHTTLKQRPFILIPINSRRVSASGRGRREWSWLALNPWAAWGMEGGSSWHPRPRTPPSAERSTHATTPRPGKTGLRVGDGVFFIPGAVCMCYNVGVSSSGEIVPSKFLWMSQTCFCSQRYYHYYYYYFPPSQPFIHSLAAQNTFPPSQLFLTSPPVYLFSSRSKHPLHHSKGCFNWFPSHLFIQ